MTTKNNNWRQQLTASGDSMERVQGKLSQSAQTYTNPMPVLPKAKYIHVKTILTYFSLIHNNAPSMYGHTLYIQE